MSYEAFLNAKSQLQSDHGFEPIHIPDALYDFQIALVQWACRKGRAAILADCGLGKTFMQLVWADNVARKTDRRVLILAPLAVAPQTVQEGRKIGIEVTHRRDELHEGDRIVVTNYERLHHFMPDDFIGVVCDESSILKSYSGQRRKEITRFMCKMPYRLLCTATAAPNDYIELGTSSEALGELSHSEMLRRFFRQLDDKGQKREQSLQDQAELIVEADPSYYRKLAYRVAQTIGQWRLKHHAVQAFWRWVASWAHACRKPSDLGFCDDGWILPPLKRTLHTIKAQTPPEGMLFQVPAFGLAEERAERKRTLQERSEFAAHLVDHDRPAVLWCHTNAEADLLERIIPGARQVAGRTPEVTKEELLNAFSQGQLRVLVIKPKIGAWGLNWQHCNHVVTYASHSYEQEYQSIRRCWRFGQKRQVDVDVIATEGEVRVIQNLERKAAKAQEMFERMIEEMKDATAIRYCDPYTKPVEVPTWL